MIKSAEEFVRLRNSEDPDEYYRAANDEAADDDVWRDIIASFPDMKEWVAYNKKVSNAILEELACDENALVRAAVADKRKISAFLFEQLSTDEDEVVRQRIAYNKKVPVEILEKLATDSSPLVRAVALKRLGRNFS